MGKRKWYEQTVEKINEDVELYYEKLYGLEEKGIKISKAGKDFRLNPCPKCGHENCCTVSNELGTLHCFSSACEWSGNHVTAYMKYAEEHGISYKMAMNKIEKITGINYIADKNSDEFKKYESELRIQKIKSKARIYYHNRLMQCEEKFNYGGNLYTPLEYLLDYRKRNIKSIKDFKIGFTGGFRELQYDLISEGYTKEEIKKAAIWAYDNMYIFFYSDPVTKDIKRINCKNPFGMTYKKENEDDISKVIPGFSAGNKLLFGFPKINFNKDVVIVEGEHDLFSVYEQGFTNVLCLGGNSETEVFNMLYMFKENAKIYAFFDNDLAGDQYRERLNEAIPDRMIYNIKYSTDYNDPDDYFKFKTEKDPSMLQLLSKAEPMFTDKFRITRDNNVWTIATRERKLVFTMRTRTEKGAKGSISYYTNGRINDREEDIFLNKCKAKIRPLNFDLHDHIDHYLNEDLENKEIMELIDIYPMSSRKEYIIKLIAEHLNKEERKDELVNLIKVSFKKVIGQESDNVVDNILKEVNDIENKNRNDLEVYQKMKIGQFFNVSANDAYMYFTYVRLDGDVKRKLPYLLRNDGALIRLDLLKRKDSQCLLLVDHKYELPVEIQNAVLELNECSLVQKWAEKYAANQVTDEELTPGLLIREIESYLKLFYFTPDADTYKILALYIYATYYYEVFGQIPYLFLNGAKGSGKSILDEAIRLLAFNAKMAIDITEAALYRILHIEGGTLILDEQENLTTKSARTTNTTMAACLKGGYSRSGEVLRANVDDKSSIDKHTVFGPKVISNIMGMDDVIVDRCIVVNTYAMKPSADSKLQDPKVYALEKLNEIRDLTSKCSLSALRHFAKAYNIYRNNIFETDNARLSQILTPLLAVAKLVDEHELETTFTEGKGEYEEALIRYWETKLKGVKSSIEDSTNEGIIKSSVKRVAEELYGIIPSNEFEKINYSSHKFSQPIKYDLNEGWFELTTLHFKDYIEQEKAGDMVYLKYISHTVKQVFNIDDNDVRRTYVNISDDNLLSEFNGNKRPRVRAYRFKFSDFIDLSNEFLSNNNNEENTKTKTKKDIALF